MVGQSTVTCRSCGAPLSQEFLDLGLSPISNAFPRMASKASGEMFYPLRALVCRRCRLVQLQDFGHREMHFNSDYAYFASFSSHWLGHAAAYVDMIIGRLGLSKASRVVEVGSNDGYLLRNFVDRGIPCLGVDPAANCADAARRHYAVDTRIGFFGAAMADRIVAEGWEADLVVANNVFAHVPDPNDFVEGLAAALSPQGTATLEFPHLLELVRGLEFDTIYHEHYSYLSLLSAEAVLSRHGLRVYDVERLPTHGGSLRLYVCHAGARRGAAPALAALRDVEQDAGMAEDGFYDAFAAQARRSKLGLLRMIVDLKSGGASICAYGAAAKGSTLLNYCGIGRDMIDFVVDRNPHKQNRTMPGTGIPILAPEAIDAARPDYVVVLPWNLQDEIMDAISHIRAWGGRFIVPVPQARIVG